VGGAVLAVPCVLLLGTGLGLIVTVPIAGALFVAGYGLPELRRRLDGPKQETRPALASGPVTTLRPLSRIERPDPLVLQDIQRMIDQFDRVQAQIPGEEGKALVWRAIEASQLVVERLQQATTPASQARRVHNKLRSYSLILTHYESLANGKLLTPDEEYKAQLLQQIEHDGLSRIARQLEQFARSMDEDEIMELEIELEMLRRLS